jgi:hypothetical protein
MKIGNVCVTLWDLAGNRPYHHALAGMGGSAIQTQTGVTTTFNHAAPTWLANFATAAAPATATLSNTLAAYTELGGQCQWTAVNGAEQDNIIFAYQVPVGSAALPGKTLFITGIRIETITTSANPAGNLTVQWALGVGATQVTLVTTSDSAGVKAPRILTLGYTSNPGGVSVGGGSVGSAWCLPIEINFHAPLVVNQSEYVHIIAKNIVGTAGTNFVRSVVFINGYFE